MPPVVGEAVVKPDGDPETARCHLISGRSLLEAATGWGVRGDAGYRIRRLPLRCSGHTPRPFGTDAGGGIAPRVLIRIEEGFHRTESRSFLHSAPSYVRFTKALPDALS